jgi:hypothetical protein
MIEEAECYYHELDLRGDGELIPTCLQASHHSPGCGRL